MVGRELGPPRTSQEDQVALFEFVMAMFGVDVVVGAP